MSFSTSLTGLNAASKDLDVTSNNIANVNSTGFKKSRAEFGDIYAVSAFGSSQTAVGQGALLQSVSQNFGQGNLQFTDRSLDVAISGNGFLTYSNTQQGDELAFSRAGTLGVNKDGYVVNNSGQYLRTLPVDEKTGSVQSTSLATSQNLRVPSGSGAPSATENIYLQANLPSEDSAPGDAFDEDNPDTYNHVTSAKVYDSLGNSHVVKTYFVKAGGDVDGDGTNNTDVNNDGTDDPNGWFVYTQFDDNPVDTDPNAAQNGYLNFNGSGEVTDKQNPSLSVDSAALGNGADTLAFDVNLDSEFTQYNASFSVQDLSQDGSTTGRLSGLNISEDGLVQANYTNGDSKFLGKIAMADFENTQGLKQIGDNSWQTTIDSGEPIVGEAGTGRFGMIQGGALESSNVDLTGELVNLITAQRNFQANAKAIETNKAVSDTIINIR